MSLYLKYRPKTLEEVRGNTGVVSTLQSMLTKESCPHAFLFYGPTGCGKTTLGRIVASMLQCEGQDLCEVDSADFRGIDTVREIRRNSRYVPMQSKCRVWIIDECHKMTNDAQNALLKILEDTPPHAYFILCTTEPQKLLSTIKGRCQQFQVEPLNERQMKGLLRGVVKAEGESIADEVYEQIINDSFGLPRNALNVLEQVLCVDEEKQLTMARQSSEQQSESIKLCRALTSPGVSWGKVADILKGLKNQEPETIRRHILAYSQTMLLNGENDIAAKIIEELYEPLYNVGFPGLVYACYSILKT